MAQHWVKYMLELKMPATSVRMHADLSDRIDMFIDEIKDEEGRKKYSSKTEFVALACLRLMLQEEQETKKNSL
jgi:hypothetical protein